ncbi:unnamed protein product, partial [Polarella glacialis]
SVTDSLGRHNMGGNRAASTARTLENCEEAEDEMLQEIQKAQRTDHDGLAECRIADKLVKRTENIAFAMEMVSAGVVVDEFSIGQETQERQRQKQRRDEEMPRHI